VTSRANLLALRRLGRTLLVMQSARVRVDTGWLDTALDLP